MTIDYYGSLRDNHSSIRTERVQRAFIRKLFGFNISLKNVNVAAHSGESFRENIFMKIRNL